MLFFNYLHSPEGNKKLIYVGWMYKNNPPSTPKVQHPSDRFQIYFLQRVVKNTTFRKILVNLSLDKHSPIVKL